MDTRYLSSTHARGVVPPVDRTTARTATALDRGPSHGRENGKEDKRQPGLTLSASPVDASVGSSHSSSHLSSRFPAKRAQRRHRGMRVAGMYGRTWYGAEEAAATAAAAAAMAVGGMSACGKSVGCMTLGCMMCCAIGLAITSAGGCCGGCCSNGMAVAEAHALPSAVTKAGASRAGAGAAAWGSTPPLRAARSSLSRRATRSAASSGVEACPMSVLCFVRAAYTAGASLCTPMKLTRRCPSRSRLPFLAVSNVSFSRPTFCITSAVESTLRAANSVRAATTSSSRAACTFRLASAFSAPSLRASNSDAACALAAPRERHSTPSTWHSARKRSSPCSERETLSKPVTFVLDLMSGSPSMAACASACAASIR
mmetsp:Transcript_6366/g.14728  ORF Transcript_6366/g.14728 Transcript_6366/m.14728 type:complete len:371 (+) Transcript_6366:377-1489(+)